VIGTIARLTLKRLTRGRTLWVAFGIATLPVILAVAGHATRHRFTDDLHKFIWFAELLVLAVLPALFVASSIGEDIEDKTITYLWSRPLPHWHVLVGKLVALAPVTVAITTVGWVVATEISTNQLSPAWTVISVGAAALAISLIAAGIGTLAPRHGMALTIIYMLLFDIPVGEIPASLQVLSVTHHMVGIAQAGAHPTGDRATPAMMMAVIAALWLLAGLARIRRLEA
jgi:ABC-type transport system involved in multi-copper enzyme maturation permease subunit